MSVKAPTEVQQVGEMPDHEPGAADSDLAWSAILAKFAYTD
jgi:hypothetical protein